MDVIIVFFGLLSGFITAALVGYIAYRVGHATGILAERARREGLEARIRQQIATAAAKDSELWETEIDA